MNGDRNNLRIGIVAARLAGTDGVSLESAKWSSVLCDMGHECFYCAGEIDRPPNKSFVMPEARFDDSRIREIHADLFRGTQRAPATAEAVHDLRRRIKQSLQQFIDEFGVELLLVENALSLPMNVPLGLAITEVVAETGIATIAHHHDFLWERPRYVINAAEDYLHAAFPPSMRSMEHVVINSHAATELARRTGLRSTVVPNVMNFEQPPVEPDEYCEDLRASLGIDDDDKLLLQPTRVVPRKRIERAIELARGLKLPCALVVSHSCGDEGMEYLDYLTDYANAMRVKVIFAADRFNHLRRIAPDGRKIYALEDAYHHADLVTYPSQVEGFGNAFLEAIYYRRPLVMSSYEIFKTDIATKGFQVVTFDEFVTRGSTQHARELILHPEQARQTAVHNYELGKQYYSFTVLRKALDDLLHRVCCA